MTKHFIADADGASLPFGDPLATITVDTTVLPGQPNFYFPKPRGPVPIGPIDIIKLLPPGYNVGPQTPGGSDGYGDDCGYDYGDDYDG